MHSSELNLALILRLEVETRTQSLLYNYRYRMMLIAIDSQNMTRSKRKRENVTKKEGSAVCSNKCQDCKLPELLLWGGTKRPFERNHHFLWQKKD